MRSWLYFAEAAGGEVFFRAELQVFFNGKRNNTVNFRSIRRLPYDGEFCHCGKLYVFPCLFLWQKYSFPKSGSILGGCYNNSPTLLGAGLIFRQDDPGCPYLLPKYLNIYILTVPSLNFKQTANKRLMYNKELQEIFALIGIWDFKFLSILLLPMLRARNID